MLKEFNRMNDLNKSVLIARLTKDAELKYMSSGSAKLDFSVAFTTSRKNGNEWVDDSNFINGLTLWGKTAENLNPYMKKGALIGIEGHLKMDSWEQEGQKKTALKLVVDNVQLLGGKKEGGQQNYQQSAPVQQNVRPAPVQAPMQPSFTDDSGFPENIPFY